MKELVKIDQNVTIVPRDFNYTNKGLVTEVSEKGFKMKMKFPATGININHICDFYSQTPNGTLYFTSHPVEIENNEIFIANPIKHRFLQRRQFTRISFLTESTMKDSNGNEYNISTIDLSAGGMKFQADVSLNLDLEYQIEVKLEEDQVLSIWLQPIRMEKLDSGKFMLSGRFVKQNNVEKMILIQYCMNKNVEEKNQ